MADEGTTVEKTYECKDYDPAIPDDTQVVTVTVTTTIVSHYETSETVCQNQCDNAVGRVAGADAEKAAIVVAVGDAGGAGP